MLSGSVKQAVQRVPVSFRSRYRWDKLSQRGLRHYLFFSEHQVHGLPSLILVAVVAVQTCSGLLRQTHFGAKSSRPCGLVFQGLTGCRELNSSWRATPKTPAAARVSSPTRRSCRSSLRSSQSARSQSRGVSSGTRRPARPDKRAASGNATNSRWQLV
jgi:hypothetical protein